MGGTASAPARRRIRRAEAGLAVVVVGLLVCLSGCVRTPSAGSGGRTASTSSWEKPRPEVAFSARVAVSETAVTVDYTVTNRDTVPVTVLNGVPPRAGAEGPVPDVDAVYVTVEDGVAVLSKTTFEQPDDVGLAVPMVMRATVLAPGGSLDEHVTVPLPLHLRTPFSDFVTAEKGLPWWVRTVRFCLGTDRGTPPPAPEWASGGDDPRPVVQHAGEAGRVDCSGDLSLGAP